MRDHINHTENSNYDAANVPVEIGRRRVHQINICHVDIVTATFLMK